MRADQILPDDVDHGRFQGVTIRKGRRIQPVNATHSLNISAGV